jgi:CheY-like chemotaxis protein
MTGILGITEDVQKQLGSTNPHRQDLEAVIIAARKAIALTKQLLAFGRRQAVSPQVLNLNHVITSMDVLFKRLIGDEVEVRTILDPHAGNVDLDEGQLVQVIVNLGLNARDAMITSGVLTLETGNVELPKDWTDGRLSLPAGAYVTLSITDTGSGMTPETISHIFEPFFTTKDEGKGTGLGLANVYGIVKQCGGGIAVESQPGRGTTFRVFFPRAGDAPEKDRQDLDRKDALGGSETVLIVEDEDIVRKVAVRALRNKGYTVLHAHDSQAALDILERHSGPIELLLTDVIMPGMNGRDLGQLAAAKRPDIKIIYMSAYSQDVLGQRGFQNNDISFIEKPFNAEGLCRKVRAVLDEASDTR